MVGIRKKIIGLLVVALVGVAVLCCIGQARENEGKKQETPVGNNEESNGSNGAVYLVSDRQKEMDEKLGIINAYKETEISDKVRDEMNQFINVFTEYPGLSYYSITDASGADEFTVYYLKNQLFGEKSAFDEVVFDVEKFDECFEKLFYSDKPVESVFADQNGKISAGGRMEYVRNGVLQIDKVVLVEGNYYILAKTVDQDLSVWEDTFENMIPGDSFTGESVVYGTVVAVVTDLGTENDHEWRLCYWSNEEPDVVKAVRNNGN